MGCDIHMYIEFSPDWADDKDYFSSFGKVRLGRDYTMFGILAGVRDSSVTNPFPPRGIPENSPEYKYNDYVLYVVENDSDAYSGDGYTTRSKANEWVERGYSKYTGADKKYVTHPDWHTTSWLSCAEFEECLLQYKLETEQNPPSTYRAVLGALKQLENSRVVFWFDN